LYKQKGIQLLLDAYRMLLEGKPDLPILNIIGDGPERPALESWIDREGLSRKICLLGSITDESTLRPYFSKAICCVSPGQAGLSVQKSFSYGVPFITSYYPISGGEFSSIVEGVTGYYYEGTVEGLANKINAVISDPNLDEVIENCNMFYHRFRSPKLWVKGFSDAIEFVLNS
jgi:glycosyltransferase involved in cell wall biosynthesis